MGSVVPAYQVPSKFEKDVIRTRSNPNNDFRNSHARTPHHLLQGTVTPNGLFFSISHSGLPDIDPAQHKLAIHGLVKQPLVYTVESLARYPMVTRMHFVECSGNSAPMFSSEPMQVTAQALHGLLQRRMDRRAAVDAAGGDRHRPEGEMAACRRGRFAGPASQRAGEEGVGRRHDRALPERRAPQPGNGYPMRLLLPGYQGNMNVKHLRRIKLIDQPAMSFYEAKTYSQILPDGKMWLFNFVQEVKSFITHPSFGHSLKGPGYYDISGIAYSNVAASPSHGLGRRRQELGAGGAAGAGSAEGVHPLPHAVAVGRPAGRAAEPGVGQIRPCSLRGGARTVVAAGDQPVGVPQPALQQHHQLGRRQQRGSSMSTRKPLLGLVLALTLALGAGLRSPSRRRGSASRSPRPTSRRGISRFCPTAPACRRAAARRHRAPRSMRRSAPCATARTG